MPKLIAKSLYLGIIVISRLTNMDAFSLPFLSGALSVKICLVGFSQAYSTFFLKFNI